jgi:hypothetical protein
MIPHASPARRATALVPAALAALALLLPASPGTAQSRRNVMVMGDGPDGSMVHMSLPDFRALRRPDYERRDLPTFTDELTLDEVQRLMVQTRLEAYLAALDALAAEMLPEAGPMVFTFNDEDGGEAGAFLSLDGIVGDALEAADLDTDGQRTAIAISVGAQMDGAGGHFVPAGGGGEGEAGEAGEEGTVEVMIAGGDGEDAAFSEPGVFVAVSGSADGEPLPEELQAQLAEHARELAERLREQLEQQEAEGGGGGGVMPFESLEAQREHFEALSEQAREFEKAKAELTRAFEQDVQLQLSPDQLDRWPRVERTLTRRRTLPDGELDGETTDLIRLFERLDLAGDETTDEQLEAYARDLHDALVRRNTYLAKTEDTVEQAVDTGRFDKALLAADRAARLRIAVRETNERYRDAIATTLDDPAGDRFRRAAREAFHPRVYRKTDADRAFVAVRRVDGLAETQPADIDELEASYRIERERVDEDIRRAILVHQPGESRRSIEAVRHVMEGGSLEIDLETGLAGDDDRDRVEEAFQRRRDLDERYMKLLYGMVPPEQVESLPSLPSERKPHIIFEQAFPLDHDHEEG